MSHRRKNTFYDFINDTKADIYIISETKFDNKYHFGCMNYNVFRNDRSSGAGGVMILSKNIIKFKNIIYNNELGEIISAEFYINNQWIKIIGAYLGIIKYKSLKKILKSKMPFIFGGDLNARNVIRVIYHRTAMVY